MASTSATPTYENPDPPPSDAWKRTGVQVIPSDSLDENTPQTPGMDRKAAITFARNGAKKLWAGTVSIQAGAKTGMYTSLERVLRFVVVM